MNILKTTSKLLRIETFILGLSGVLMLLDVLKILHFSITSILFLIGTALLLLLMDARMVRARKELSRTQGFQIGSLLFFLGLFLIYSPLEMLQYTRLDSYNIAALLLGIALIVTNAVLLAALWVLSRGRRSS